MQKVILKFPLTHICFLSHVLLVPEGSSSLLKAVFLPLANRRRLTAMGIVHSWWAVLASLLVESQTQFTTRGPHLFCVSKCFLTNVPVWDCICVDYPQYIKLCCQSQHQRILCRQRRTVQWQFEHSIQIRSLEVGISEMFASIKA